LVGGIPLYSDIKHPWYFTFILLFLGLFCLDVNAEMEAENLYYPGTEQLAANEMRVIALGTGTPQIRPAQAATSWLVELGNGDKFFFDVGVGSMRNFSTLKIPYDYANTVFLSHLHIDHIGDLDALWASGWTSGRLQPLRVWGPSGPTPELGTKHYVNTLREAMNWDYASRSGRLPESGSALEVHEFDYRKTQVVYEENGVKVSSFPATHIIDGAVSYRLEWNGLTMVFSGDSTPNKWMMMNAMGADLLIHEVYMTLPQLQQRFGWSEQMASMIARVVHTSPAAAGKIFSKLQPRMAVGFHFLNDADIVPDIEREIRKTYQGPLAMARDLMVFNVTNDKITVRQAVMDEYVSPVPADKKKYAEAKRAQNPMVLSDWAKEGLLSLD